MSVNLRDDAQNLSGFSSVVSSRYGSRAVSKELILSRHGTKELEGQALPPVMSCRSNRFLVKNALDNFEADCMELAGLSRFDNSMNTMQLGGRPSTSGSIQKGALAAGWTLRPSTCGTISRPGTTGGRATADVLLQKPPCALEKNQGADFTGYAMAQLNQMYAHMEQLMSRERARHSSDVHLLMRKVDKDLKDTFRSVRETFFTLTQQVQELLREVEHGKKRIKAVQDRFDAAQTSAAIRAQYVEELEAVLDGQVPDISKAMSKLSEDLTVSRAAMKQAAAKMEDKENEIAQERADLKAVIKTLEGRLNEKTVLGFAGATELPLLPEMSATWTRRQDNPDNLASSTAPSGPNIVDAQMSRSDATRGVTRMKNVRPLGTRHSSATSSVTQLPRHLTREQQDELKLKAAGLKERAQLAEQRVAKQHLIFLDAAPSLQLLREIFAELRQNWRLKVADPAALKDIESLREELAQKAKAPDLLDCITHKFVETFPQLGNFSEVLEALCEEAQLPVPSLWHVAESMPGYDQESESMDTSRIGTVEDVNPTSPPIDETGFQEEAEDGSSENDEDEEAFPSADLGFTPSLLGPIGGFKPDRLRGLPRAGALGAMPSISPRC